MSAVIEGLPIGDMVDATPAERPDAVRLSGRFCRIEKLDLVRHAESLWLAVKDHDALWTYMGYGPFPDEATFLRWVEERTVMLDPLSYAVVDLQRDRAVGIVALMEIRPAMGVIEMGNIVYSPLLQRRPAATEAQYLIARYVFDDLRYRRYEWKCNALNAPSRLAAQRLGFTYEGTFRQHVIVKGRNRDTAWFSMLDTEWPARCAAFERWLAPENFDAQGRQMQSLSALHAAG
jgi:RimJ/RimL family protein N-acetyltransferase